MPPLWRLALLLVPQAREGHLAEPTTAAIHDSNAWVVEGQLSYDFGVPGNPTLPFRVKRGFLD